jgi:hypothetical protein
MKILPDEEQGGDRGGTTPAKYEFYRLRTSLANRRGLPQPTGKARHERMGGTIA